MNAHDHPESTCPFCSDEVDVYAAGVRLTACGECLVVLGLRSPAPAADIP